MWKPKMPKFTVITGWWLRLHQEKKPTLMGAWKRFIRQIPADSRALVKSHKHFIVFGGPNSGKTELIQGLIQQSEDLFPFDTIYHEESMIQLFFGPKQIVHEIEFPTLEDRSIKMRKQIIRFWKKLFQNRDPIVVIVQNWADEETQDTHDFSRLAQLIGGKLSLLSEICKKPIKVRINLTHLDKIEGYLEFAHYLKQQDLTFSIPLTSRFAVNTLEEKFQTFADQHLPNMLTSLSDKEFIKIQRFFREVPKAFPKIEEFLRAVITRVRSKGFVDLEMLTFSSNSEGSTSLVPFDWKKEAAAAIFFRYPMLKHQIAAVFVASIICGFTYKLYHNDKEHLALANRGIDLLRRCEVAKFQREVLPKYAKLLHFQKPSLYSYALPKFYFKQICKAEEALVKQMYRHILEPNFCHMLLKEEIEFQYIYYLGLMYAVKRNDVGSCFIENLEAFAHQMDLDPNFIKTYIFLSKTPGYQLAKEKTVKINPNLSLTSLRPWIKFLKYFDRLNNEPVFMSHNFETLHFEAVNLLNTLDYLQNNPVVAFASVLEEDKNFQNAPPEEFEHVKTVSWIYQNRHKLKEFLLFIKNTSIDLPDVRNLNISQLFAQVDEIQKINQIPETLFNFIIEGNSYSFLSKKWTELTVNHSVQRALQEFIVHNTNSGGRIFFTNCDQPLPPVMTTFMGQFPLIREDRAVPAKYSRIAFEKNVRMTTEVLLEKVEELPLAKDEKIRFNHFLRNEVASYIKKFQEHYLSFYHACQINTEGLQEIKGTLRGLLKTTAPFYDFLQCFHYHSGAFSQETSCLESFEELNQFAFLANIFDVENREEALEPYFRVVADILSDLERDSPESLDSFPYLSANLTPAANIGLQILQNTEGSYRNQVIASLEEMEIPKYFHKPFLQPIEALYKVGLIELKKIIEDLWREELSPSVNALFEKFPFALDSNKIASIEEVAAKLNPKSQLWQRVHELISSVSKQDGDRWVSKDPENINLNGQIFSLLSRFSKATNGLWDEKGNPRELTFKFRPIPFSYTANVNPLPICSYIRVGDKIFRNFNQESATETLRFPWWEELPACVGVELLNKKTRVTSHRTKKEAPKHWSFFHVLKQGRQESKNLWTWTFPSGQGEVREASIFFETSPDTLFSWDRERIE
ncbi:MAG: hypothetical protein SNF33_06030 [Candidatus Algichlamydia australiensis]|nr:hypothetical protein [Chlamydiales bacterium]